MTCRPLEGGEGEREESLSAVDFAVIMNILDFRLARESIVLPSTRVSFFGKEHASHLGQIGEDERLDE